ncbi:bromodomain adjacent to zinc finger domain protein 2B [Diretmus argenteus]
MESGERLASPAPTLSAARTSSPAASSSSSSSSSSSPAPHPKSSLAPSPSALGSTLSTSGRLFGAAGEQPFIGSTLSSAFPLVNHPAFGALYTTGAGRPEFGGLGSLGMSAALAAHPQLGALSEWWRAAEAHGRGAAAFLPPFLGFPPFFTPHLQPNHSTSPLQSRMPSKNSRAPPKGVNGAVNGSGVSPPTTQAGSYSVSPAPIQTSTKPAKNPDHSNSHRSSPQTNSADVPHKPKDKKPRKKPTDTSGVSNSESGTSSDSSSDGSLSSDLEDLVEDDDDDDEDDEDDDEEDKQSEVSDTEKRTKKKTKVLPSSGRGKTDREPQDNRDRQPHNLTSTSPTLPCSPSPPALSQTSPLALHSCRPRTEGLQQHFSVIQSTGLATSSKPLALLTQPCRESSPSASPIALTTSPKAVSSTASPKPPKLLPSSSPQHLPLSLCSSPKPLSVPSPPRSALPLSTSPKPFALTSPVTSSQKPSLKPPQHAAPGSAKAHKRKMLEASLAQINEFRMKQTLLSQGQAFPADLKKQQQGPNKSPKRTSVSSSLLPPAPPLPQNNHSNLFLSSALLGLPEPHHPNGVIQSTTQDAPLALITKPRKDSASQGKPPQCDSDAGSVPVNLSTGGNRTQAAPQAGPPSRPSTTSPHATGHGSRKNKTPKVKGQAPGLGQGQGPADPLAAWKGFSQNHLVQSLVDLFRGGESGIGIPGVGIPGVGVPGVGIPGVCIPTAGLPANKESDDSGDEDDDEDDDLEDEEDEEDSDDSLSESDSNSDSDVSGKKVKELKLLPSGLSSKKEKTPLRLTKGPQLLSTSTNHTATSCSPLNLQVIKTPTIVTSSSALAYHSSPCSSSYTLATPSGLGKRKRVMDEKELMIPLELGWQRETRIKTVAGRPQGEVAYYAPCGKKLRQYPDVMKYLSRNGVSGITRGNFSFSAKIRVGDFYEAREGPQGLQWSLLKEEEVIPHILAMEGRRGRPPNSERQSGGGGAKGNRRRKGRPPNVADPVAPEGPSPSEVKLLRKLEAQEIARQAAQMKLMRKLEKQALARAAKEARKQQAIMAAEERRKQKEQIKILKQQEKIKRIQQIRMEKELRAQQILEAKRRKKEEVANAKILEAEKRIKEKEIRRQQAEILKHQELERHRLDMERERRRQHVMLMKAVESRKKAEERERLRQEKRDEKRLNKERKLEQRRLELEMARELKKPNEDMCLSDHTPLPEFSRIPGLILPGRAVSNCLMLMQFLRGFGKVLGLDINVDVPTLGMLQEGLLNVGDSMGHVQDLLVRLLSLAVCDPGLPPGQKTKTILGDHLTNVGINRDNVSEVLQMYMGAHCANTELAPLALSLKTKAFQAHTPAQKASILGFLANELACSKAVISEVDKSLDQMANMRKDKIIMEGKLKKLRTIHAKRTGKREASVGVEENQSLGTPSSAMKRKRKPGGDSEDDDDDDDDSDDQAEEDDEEEEEEIKKAKKVETCDEDEGDQTTSIEELEKQIEKLAKQHHQIRRKLFEASHSLRSMMYGQDRYRRRYWVLPHCGGVFIEAMESGEAPEELEEERQRRRRAAEEVKVKEEPQEVEVQKEKPVADLGGQSRRRQGSEQQKEEEKEHEGKKISPALFCQQTGCVSKLFSHRDVAKDVVKETLKAENKERSHPRQNGSPASTPTATPIATFSSSLGNNSEPALATPPSTVTTNDTANVPPPASASSSLLCPPAPRESPGNTPPTSSLAPSAYLSFQANDQLLRVLTERSGHWFSLLPRTPCDMSSLTTSPPGVPRASPLSSSTPARPRSPPPSPALPLTPSAASASASPHHPSGLLNYPLSALQVKSGGSLLGVPFCGWPSGMMSTSLPLCSSPMLGHSLESTMAASVSSKSESPLPRLEKIPPVPSPAPEIPKSLDHPIPRPIPEEMLTGWWRVSYIEELRALVSALHSRGFREKGLQRQMQKYMEIIPQVCTKHRDVAMIELCELEESQVSVESVRGWCVEEQAMEMDIAVLQQVEELERKVTTASLQVKGWTYPDPQSEREDLVYYEHKPLAKLAPAAANTGDKDCKEHQEERVEKGGVMRHPDNPLDIAVTRLADLERNIERRYLRSPLGTTIQIRLDNVGTVTVPAPAPSTSADREGGEEEVAHGMKVWRKALSEVRSAAQLAMCIQQLQKSIAWERSIMKVYCQMCRKGDNEDLLLLCDGCDKGCHTYCHKPKITSIPEGDWYCPACISKASGPSPKSKKPLSKPVAPSAGGAGGKKGVEVKKNGKQAGNGEVSEDDTASASSTPKKSAKDTNKKRKTEESSPAPPAANQESPVCVKRAKTARDNNRDLGLCRVLLAELERHQDAWPFLSPVNLKSVPGYRKVIKKPMDFSTIREKLVSSQYQNLETFIIDVNLVFDNCEKFNEDNSDIGRAGHNMRKFFEKRWTELLKQTN